LLALNLKAKTTSALSAGLTGSKMNSTHEQAQCAQSSTFHHISCDSGALGARWHYHDEFEFHYFRSFSGIALVGDYIGELLPNSLFLLAPGMPHSWTGTALQQSQDEEVPADNKAADVMVLVPEASVSGSISVFPELRAIEQMIKDSQFGIEFKNCSEIAEIGELMLGMKKLEGCARLAQFFLILDRLAKCQYQKLSSLRLFNHKESCGSEVLGRSMSYIDEHFKENVTLEVVSKISNMSTAYFCRIFKKTNGVGFLDYVNGLRVRCACELLRETDDPVSSIGYECGYPNISNFNRNFRKYIGKTPSEFRDDWKKASD
jgi:AraC-like DNA-binding protein